PRGGLPRLRAPPPPGRHPGRRGRRLQPAGAVPGSRRRPQRDGAERRRLRPADRPDGRRGARRRPVAGAARRRRAGAASRPGRPALARDRPRRADRRVSGPTTLALSVVTDEIDQDLARALDVAAELGVDRVELRTLWGKNVI